jgi:hypothetical protein
MVPFLGTSGVLIPISRRRWTNLAWTKVNMGLTGGPMPKKVKLLGGKETLA